MRGPWRAACLSLMWLGLQHQGAAAQSGSDGVPIGRSDSASVRSLEATGGLGSAAPRVPRQAGLPEWDEGSLGLAVGETLLTNFVSWLGAEYVTSYKDITRISPTTWRENVRAGPVWDDNFFEINWVLHPYQGSHYFGAGRANGYGYWKSFLFTALGSAMWECCGESHRASKSDLVTTTVGGSAMGEIFYRLGTRMLSRGCLPVDVLIGGRCWLGKAAVLLTTPTRPLTDVALGRGAVPPGGFGRRELPQAWDAGLAAGWTVPNAGPFVELRYTYQELDSIATGDAPFSHFATVAEMDFGARTALARVQARGILYPWVIRRSLRSSLLVVLFQGFDYVNRDAYVFGMQSVGGSASFRWGTPTSLSVVGTVGAHGGLGSVTSEEAWRGPILDHQERDRDYDMSWAVGGEGSIAVGIRWVRLSGFLRADRLNVLHGSNAGGWDAHHTVASYGGALAFPRIRRNSLGLGFGADLKYFRRETGFGNPKFTERSGFERRLRLYATIDTHDLPKGLLMF